MKNLSRSGYPARLLAFVLAFACAPSVLAQPTPFAGRWLPDDRSGAQAASPMLTIKGASLSWSGPDKSAAPCVQAFVLKKESPGTVYTDGRGTKFVAGAIGSFPTYLLRLGASACGGGAEEVRISFPLAYDTDHIELVEYVKGRPVAARRYRRKK